MERTSSRFTPKYWQLVQQFRQQIEVGLLKPGDRLPSYVEMRKHHGVSRPTTERIHAVLEKEGLILREAGRGIFVAEPGVQEKRAVIGFGGASVIVPDNPYTARIVQGIHEVADREGVEILLFNKSSTVAWEKVDGVVICEMSPEPWLHRLPPGMPAVVLLTATDIAPSVTSDDRGGMREATRYLAELGHRRIGYLNAIPGPMLQTGLHPLAIERILGYQEGLRAARIEADSRWLHSMPIRFKGQRFTDRGREAMEQWLKEDWHELGCTALLCQNDDAAVGVIQVLQEAGISVPDDVSIVGFDGTDLAEYCTPRLTTIEVPLREMSQLAAEVLLRQIGQNLEMLQSRSGGHIMPTRLVVRESTAPPRI